jgi:hypothetical protein
LKVKLCRLGVTSSSARAWARCEAAPLEPLRVAKSITRFGAQAIASQPSDLIESYRGIVDDATSDRSFS